MRNMAKGTKMGARLTAAALLMASVAGVSPARAEADLILLNGRIHAPGGWQEALAVKDGRIVAIGKSADVARDRTAATRVVDLGGKTVLPGLHDMHVHPMMAGIELTRCRFGQGATPREILDVVAGCARAKKPGEWITGGQWQGISFGDTPPHRSMLDEVAPANPVVLTDISAHSSWANSMALKLAGITRDTPNPKGGIIERDRKGEPTGILRESAARLVRDLVPPDTPEQNSAALATALGIMLSHGITSLTDAHVTPDNLKAYLSLADSGRLSQRVRACLTYGREWGQSGSFEANLAARSSFTRDRFRLDCVKVFMDGVPTESRTAAMLEPYVPPEDSHAHGPERGLLLVQPDELNPLVTRLDKQGVTVKFHAAGDWAARTALDAVAAARKANGMGGPTHDVGHLTFIDRADIARAKGINATLEYSPYLWFPSPINDDIIKVSGLERIERVWPVREGLDAGGLVVVGSDWPVVPSANPWIGIETLVTRRAPNGERPGEVYGPAETIALKEAIDLFTIKAARQMGREDSLGSLEKGKIADLIVLDRNPFEIPVTDLHNVVVEQAFIAGERVYAATAGSQ